MKATLIEIDATCPPGQVYSDLAGRQFWAVSGTEVMEDDGCWCVLAGQGYRGLTGPLIVLAEHAWLVREGEVELVLREVTSPLTQPDLGLEANEPLHRVPL